MMTYTPSDRDVGGEDPKPLTICVFCGDSSQKNAEATGIVPSWLHGIEDAPYEEVTCRAW